MSTKDKEKDPTPPVEEMPAEEPTHLVVIFAQDYRGKLTAEQYYTAGTRVEFPAEQARALVDAGRAKFVVDVK
jgi:hypothetical protein